MHFTAIQVRHSYQKEIFQENLYHPTPPFVSRFMCSLLMCYHSDLASIQSDLYAFVKARIVSESDAHDIVQDSNQVLINKEDQYNPAYPFKAWAFGIAKWQILAYFKRNKRSRVTLSLDVHQEIPLNSNFLADVPFSSLIRKERLDLIKGLNHMLSRRQF